MAGAVELRPDCSRCTGLCCVALPLTASADFAIDKAAGIPCPHLGTDFRCGIHSRLRERGFPGCSAYDCFGAGQRTAALFAGQDWRGSARAARDIFAAFATLQRLHELLWYLTEALSHPDAAPLRPELDRLSAEVHRQAALGPERLPGLDPAGVHGQVSELLRRCSLVIRTGRDPAEAGNSAEPSDPADPSHPAEAGDTAEAGAELPGAELIGAALRGRDLRRANLRGAYLIGADLRGADLRGADLLGADLRAADLRGCLFLTPAQLSAARGDAGTRLSPGRRPPEHWTGA